MENRVYVENKDNFWRDLLVRIALVLLFIFLLIWLFPMPKLETFYDRIFADNIKMMQDAAKDYFTVERLPKEIGDKEKLTLREMLDKKMILPFLDRDGNACNFDESYVEVIMMGVEDYVFKTNLSCPTKTDYVIDYFGCYDVCEDDSCTEKQKTVLEYQFSRDTTKNIIDKYECPTGYTVNGSSCVRESSIIDRLAANLSCAAGFTYNKNTDSCEKTESSSTNAEKTCPTGYTYSSNSNSCLKYIVNDQTPVPVCSTGTYDANSGKCIVGNTTTYNASLVCDSGTYNPSTGKCVIPGSSTYGASLVCTQGTDNGSSCTIAAATTIAAIPRTTTSTTTAYLTATITKKWSCEVEEYTTSKPYQNTSTFTRTVIGSEVRYSCAAKTTSCLIIVYKYEECTAINYGTCSDKSYTYNNSLGKCTKQVTTSSTTYSCANGATPSGDRCPVAAVTVPKEYKCLSGGTLSGSTCTVSTSSSVNPRYKCSNGGSLSGSVCYVSGTSTQNPTYSCKLGTLVGNICKVTTIDNKAFAYNCSLGTISGSKCYTSKLISDNVTYNCNAGYTRTGTECVKTTTSSSVVNGIAVYKSSSTTEYKWSRETSINGWNKTGKTREVTVAVNSK